MSNLLPNSSGLILTCTFGLIPHHRFSQLLQDCGLVVGGLERDLGCLTQLLGGPPDLLRGLPGLLTHDAEVLVCAPQVLGGGPGSLGPTPIVLTPPPGIFLCLPGVFFQRPIFFVLLARQLGAGADFLPDFLLVAGAESPGGPARTCHRRRPPSSG